MTETSSKEYVLGVGGMTCNNCVNHVETALSNIDGVSDVEAGAMQGQIMMMNLEVLTLVQIRVMLDLDKPADGFQ